MDGTSSAHQNEVNVKDRGETVQVEGFYVKIFLLQRR